MKKGISLIVLVITIIIIIILAGAVILNLNNNNPMDNANKAALMQEETDFRSGAALWIFKIIADTKENPFIAVKASGDFPTADDTAAYTAIGSSSAASLALDSTGATYVGTNGEALPAGYYDLANIIVIPWKNSDAAVTGNSAGGVGTLVLDRTKAVTGYDQFITAIGMKPSKAGENSQYKIAMNANGNTIFYALKSSLNNRAANQ